MSYQNFLKYLAGLHENRIRPGLGRVLEASKLLGHPGEQFKSVHIAGTNGKGSTAAFLESIVRHSGYKVGLYTSPHLVDVRERIQIDRGLVSEAEIEALSEQVLDKCGNVSPSYFEHLTLIAFLYFAKSKVDLAIIETGLGGRLDATNIITPLLSILTPISRDHMEWLGNNVRDIAREKCGIIKRGVTVVSAPQENVVMEEILSSCKEVGANLCCLVEDGSQTNNYQLANASLALAAGNELKKHGFKIKDEPESTKKTVWPGRLQLISREPEVLLDGAHNIAGCLALKKFITDNYKGREIVFIFAVMKDKEIVPMLDIFGDVASGWVLFELGSERAAEPRDIAARINSEKVVYSNDVEDATDKALSFGLKNPLIVVTGSLYLVGRFLGGLSLSD